MGKKLSNNMLKIETGVCKEQVSGKVEDNLIANIERVVNIAIMGHLCDSVYEMANDELTYIAGRLGISKNQALLFSLFMELSEDSEIESADLANLTGCRNVRILSILSEDKALIERGLIRQRNIDGEVTYKVPRNTITAIKNNETVVKKAEKLNIDEFFERLEKILLDGEENVRTVAEDLTDLISENMHLEFCRAFNKHFARLKYDYNGILFIIFAHYLVNEGVENVGDHLWARFFTNFQIRAIRNDLTNKTCQILAKHLIEESGSNGMRELNYYRITDKTRAEFFVGVKGLNVSKSKKAKDLLSYERLSKKKLFYNESEGGQINQLSSLLSAGKFNKIQKRLEQVGMRKGFACLFYGAPGTGKTETVYQLAKKTKRDLFVIDVAKIKSCWVGESEKNITQAFLKYNQYVNSCRINKKNIPILLFNEADAVLGIRKRGAESSVDKMENSIQNIILQEMERLDGIMIATTNLTTNLDKAFERRFLYKIEFNKPTQDVKCSIWQSMIPKLSQKLATQLAGEFDFTGGQIENIARKRAVEIILTGKEPTDEQLKEFCKQETLNSIKELPKIGFIKTK